MSRIHDLWTLLTKKRDKLFPAFNALDEERYYQHNVQQHGMSQLPSISYADLVGEGEVVIKNYTYLEGNSLPTDMALIKQVAKRLQPCTFLEIGSWRGETLSNVAEVADECYSLTLGEEDMKRLGMPKAFADNHAIFTEGMSNIQVFHHDSLTFDFSKLPKRPNLIFVDGDHSYEAVRSDTANAFKVLEEGGVIIWHDYGHSTESVRADVLAGILDGTPEAFKKHLYHVSNTMCAIFMKESFATSQVTSLAKPSLSFTVQVKANRLNT